MFANNKAKELIKDKKVGEFPEQERKVIAVNVTETLEGVANTLSEHKFLSVPVVDDKGEFVQFVDTLDICAFAFCRRAVAASSLSTVPALNAYKLADLLAAKTRCRGPAVEAVSDHPLSYVMELLADGNRRVLVNNSESGKPQNIITQSDVARWLYTEIGMTGCAGPLGDLGKLDLKELGFGAKPLLSTRATTCVANVVDILAQQKHNAVAIVDAASGKLVASFSASNLDASTLFAKDQTAADDMKLSVVDYLKKYSPKSLEPVTTRMHQYTLSEILKQMNDGHLHHVWVVDDDEKPIGVVSLTDVLSSMCEWEEASQ